jgi:catechol 2,3-dioxygenase-like lactoylglutathione lyase family enzyme
MLTAIVAVTMTAPDLEAAERAYARHLDYRAIERGRVSRQLAEALDARATEGRRYVLMQPSTGGPFVLRIVQSRATPGHAPMKTHGWNANELVYLTRIPPEGGKVIATAARSRVDRTFIVVVGGPDIEAMRAFYRDRLRMQVTPAAPTPIGVLNDAWGLPAEHETPLALALIPPDFAIEIDQYPVASKPRPRRKGDLPPGLAIVSFEVKSLDAFEVEWKVAPATRQGKPYEGRRSALLVGAAGEWAELVESALR